MSEITLALEHPSLGCGEIIARYDLSKIQEKAYEQGRADERAKVIEEFAKRVKALRYNCSDDGGDTWYKTQKFCDRDIEEIAKQLKN